MNHRHHYFIYLGDAVRWGGGWRFGGHASQMCKCVTCDNILCSHANPVLRLSAFRKSAKLYDVRECCRSWWKRVLLTRLNSWSICISRRTTTHLFWLNRNRVGRLHRMPRFWFRARQRSIVLAIECIYIYEFVINQMDKSSIVQSIVFPRNRMLFFSSFAGFWFPIWFSLRRVCVSVWVHTQNCGEF